MCIYSLSTSCTLNKRDGSLRNSNLRQRSTPDLFRPPCVLVHPTLWWLASDELSSCGYARKSKPIRVTASSRFLLTPQVHRPHPWQVANPVGVACAAVSPAGCGLRACRLALAHRSPQFPNLHDVQVWWYTNLIQLSFLKWRGTHNSVDLGKTNRVWT